MKALEFKTKSEILEYYPGLEAYLSKFTDPKVALLGNFSDPENFLVEHVNVGIHEVISVPILEDTLRYDLIEKLYSGSKKYDTFSCEELPLGYECNYETFLVMTGGGTAAMIRTQPQVGEVGGPQFHLYIKATQSSYVSATLGGVELELDESGTYFTCDKSLLDPLLSQIESDTKYPGSAIMEVQPTPEFWMYACSVYKEEDPEEGTVYSWITYNTPEVEEEEDPYTLIANIYLVDNTYKIVPSV